MESTTTYKNKYSLNSNSTGYKIESRNSHYIPLDSLKVFLFKNKAKSAGRNTEGVVVFQDDLAKAIKIIQKQKKHCLYCKRRIMI